MPVTSIGPLLLGLYSVVLLATAALLLFAISAWGWGALVLRACRLEVHGDAPYAVALGLAALAAAGGPLNLVGLAYAPMLWALLAAGWAIAARRLWQGRAGLQISFGSGSLAWAAPAAIGLLLTAALLPGLAFNWGDDFQWYFQRVVRMLQTGTLGGNPFDSVGYDSLGSQVFLQAFTLLVFHVDSLNAFDAVFCATLTLALVVSVARGLRARPLHLFCALAVAVLLHPQQVNISPVYSQAAFLLAFVTAAAGLAAQSVPAGRALWRCAAPPGLILAALAGLKATVAAALVPMAFAFGALLWLREGSWRAALRALLATGAWSALFLAPWLLLHADKYARLLRGAPGEGRADFAGSPLGLLQDQVLFWGASVFSYDAAAAIVLGTAAAGLAWLARRGDRAHPPLLEALLALCIGATLAVLLNTFPFGAPHSLRQSAPALIAALPAAPLLAGWLLRDKRAAALVALAVLAVLAYCFAPVLAQRVHRAAGLRTVVSFPIDDSQGVRRFFATELGAAGARAARGAQSLVPAGEGILVLTTNSYHLHFARNRIFPATDAGVASLGSDLPLGAPPAALRAYLRSRGIRYVIRETDLWPDLGIDSRIAWPLVLEQRIGARMRWFRDALAELERSSTLLLDHPRLVVTDLQ